MSSQNNESPLPIETNVRSQSFYDSPKAIEVPSKNKKAATAPIKLWVAATLDMLGTTEGEILISSTILKVLLFPS